MLTFYLISIAVYILTMSLLGRLQVKEGKPITVEELFWFSLMCLVPILNTIVAVLGCVFIFDHYKDRPVFGGKEEC